MIRALRLPLAVVFLVVAVVVVVALAADQPAAPQPQMVRFVSHFIAFTPKDPSVLNAPPEALKAFPRWELPYLDSRYPQPMVTTIRGYVQRKALEDLAPELGPFDVLKARDPKAVAEFLKRLDNAWDYHVLTLSGSGNIGDLVVQGGHLGPIPLKTPDGIEIGPLDNTEFYLMSIVRVEKVLGDGHALVQGTAFVGCSAFGFGGVGGRGSETKLAAPAEAFGAAATMRGYTSAIGARYPRAPYPGIICLETIDLGAWDSQEPPLYY